MATPDITIRGAGIFGLSVAWALTLRGAAVRVVDPHGVGAGASGGIVGALAPHVPENWNPKKQFQLESLLMAEGFWRAVENAGGVSSGYARSGRIQPIADAAAQDRALARAQSAQTLWGAAATWTVRPATEGSWGAVSASGTEVFDTLSAHLHPRRACAALAAALQARGVAVAAEGPDSAITLHATGVAGLAALGEGRPRMVGTGIKGQAALLDHAAPGAPQIFADTLHIIPHADGTTAVGATTEREFSDPAGTDAQLEALIARARVAVPALRDAPVIARWAALRPRSRSRAPCLGPWPGRPGHYVVNGGFKIGFGMAPKIAEVMADLVLEGRDRIPDGFRVDASF